MIYVSREIAVNATRGPDDPVLTRTQMWAGLKMKADNALPFVPAMTKCDVIERTATGLTRDVEVRGQPARERITFYPERKVVFLRLSGFVDGLIVNEILNDTAGELKLRFSFAMQLVDADSDSAQESELRSVMERDYLAAVDATLAAIRRAVNEKKL